MLYRPPDPTLRLWDTWIFRVDDAFHLFHLQASEGDVGCTSIGHAVTRDWVHWETLPTVLERGRDTAWDAGPLMTGMVVPHEGRYFLFYGSMVDRVQRIGLAVSDDLIAWEKLGDRPILEAAGPWYETDPAQTLNYETAWRDPYVFYHAPDACYYAFICARAAGAGDTGGGCVAVARSTDLLTWTLLPPAYVSDAHTCLEVPEYFRLGDRHIITYTASYHFGTPYPAHDPYQAAGSFYLESEALLSGYHVPDGDDRLNTSAPLGVRNYVGRSIPDPADPTRRLYYYHHVLPAPGDPPPGSLSAIKYLEADADGTPTLRYAPLLEPFTGRAVRADAPLGPDQPLALLAEDAADGIFEATVNVPYAGICFRMERGADGVPHGMAAWLAPSHAGDTNLVVMLGTVRFPNGRTGQRPYFGGPLALARLASGASDFPLRLRVVCRDAFADVYVDEVLRISYTFDAAHQPGGAGAGAFYAGLPKAGPVGHVSVRRFELDR